MSHPADPLIPFQLLEINIISAQDLASLSRSMRTYAVAWVHPNRKLSTRVDQYGHTNPTWNDKFVFRVEDQFLRSDTSAIMIEIYALRCFRDMHVGTVRVLVSNILPPPQNPASSRRGTRFVALQVRRPSSRPQGILNMGVAILDGSMRSMPLYTQLSSSALGYRNLMGESNYDPHHHKEHSSYPRLQPRPSKSDVSTDVGGDDYPPGKAESTVDGSEFAAKGESGWSDSVATGPSFVAPLKKKGDEFFTESVRSKPSFVTPAKKKMDEFYPETEDSSTVDGWSMATEDLKSKLERWKTELPPVFDHGFGSFRSTTTAATESVVVPRRGRRKTEGGGGLFACFGDSFGCECSIFCGLNPRKKVVAS